ncbi:helix-turn-helix transcriptional regulator [Serratia plymuthica]|uniref:helix-turn-helix transcriptional regulator n=1 Tax=Serratia TaxID=613 RepID=UPI0018E49760|nr:MULTISPECIES: helix-turn-helix transcriptional regulator [Serratia]MBI6137517.1 helix-turn-helix transcriptional regulator [Serratia plymuthica]CAI0821602.1 transcriptional regulator, y4mF family [Serratia liquefaciens]
MSRNTDFVRTFSLSINRLRLERGLTIEQLADLASVHRTTIGLIERSERSPTLQVAKQIADALEMKLSTIIQLAENELDIKK